MGADEVRAAAPTGPGVKCSHWGEPQRSRIPVLSTELFPAGVTPQETIF
jgi:hypothetical protein